MAVLALASCAKFEDEPKIKFGEISAPSVKLEVTGDNSVYIEVVPGANTGYYSYVLLAGDITPDKINPEQILNGKLKGVKNQVANAAEADTLKAAVDKLNANSSYTLFAVAANKETHNLSELAFKTVTTTDETAPVVLEDDYDYETEGESLIYYVPFDDPIELTDTASFSVVQFGANYDAGSRGYYQLLPIGQYPVPADSVSLDEDGWVVVNVPKEAYAPNAILALLIGPGSVVNELGNVNAAYTKSTIVLQGTYAGTVLGLVAQYDSKPFELECPIAEDSVFKFSDPSLCKLALTPVVIGADNEAGYYGENSSDGIQATYVHATSGRTVSYTLSNWDYDASGNLLLETDEDPEVGYYVNYEIAEDCIQDIYGNPNAALSIENQLLCSYNYSFDAIIGDYDVTTIDAMAGAYADTTLSIAALAEPDEDGNNIVFTDFLGFPGVPAYFDQDLGTIELSPYTSTSPAFKLGFNGEPSATIAVPAAGKLSNSGSYFLFSPVTGSGYYGVFVNISATRK